MVLLHPPATGAPRRAPSRSCVLGSEKSSMYHWERAGLGRLRAGLVRYQYACAVVFGCGLVG